MSISKRLVFCVVAFGFLFNAVNAQNFKIEKSWQTTESRQFDFWIGAWDVNLRMIQPDNSWKDSVKAKVEIYPILDGKAILELWDSKPIKGFSLRHFDPQKKKWVLYLNWPNNGRSNIGSLEGEFRHGRGEFFSKFKGKDGKEILSRYTFCDITPASLRWDDAFSNDGGKTWTNNWIMEFSRTAKTAGWTTSDKANTFVTGSRCSGKEFDMLNSVAGKWKGKIVLGQSGQQSADASLNVVRILDGCTIIHFLEYKVEGKVQREFGLMTFNRQTQQFEELVLDNQVGSAAKIFRGKLEGKQGFSLKTGKANANSKISLLRQWNFPAESIGELSVNTKTSKDKGTTWADSIRGSFKRINK